MVVSDVLYSSANDGECVMKTFVVPVPKFLCDMKWESLYADSTGVTDPAAAFRDSH